MQPRGNPTTEGWVFSGASATIILAACCDQFAHHANWASQAKFDLSFLALIMVLLQVSMMIHHTKSTSSD